MWVEIRIKDGVNAATTGSSGIARIRAWIHLADFGSENIEGHILKSWKSPSAGLEVWDWHILGEKHLKENPSVLTAARDSREQGDSHWAVHSWEIFKSPLFNFWIYFRRVLGTLILAAGLHMASPLGSVLLKWEKGKFYSWYHCRCDQGRVKSLISPCTSGFAGLLSVLVLRSETGGEFSCSRGAFVGNLI